MQITLRLVNQLENIKRFVIKSCHMNIAQVLSRAHALALLSKVFLLNFPFDLPGSEGKLNLNVVPEDELEIFPPVASSECQHHDVIQAHATEVVGNLVVQLILRLDEQVRHLERSLISDTAISSPLQFLKSPLSLIKGESESSRSPFEVFKSGSKSRSSVSSNSETPPKSFDVPAFDPTGEGGDSRLYRKGKLLTWTGDVSLCVSSPLDALLRYSLALASLRSPGLSPQELERGVRWQGSALEGIAASLALAVQSGVPEDEIISFYRSLEDTRGVSPLKDASSEREVLSALDMAVKSVEEALNLCRKRPALAEVRVASFIKLATLLTLKIEKYNDDPYTAIIDQKTRVGHIQCIKVNSVIHKMDVGGQVLYSSVPSGHPS